MTGQTHLGLGSPKYPRASRLTLHKVAVYRSCFKLSGILSITCFRSLQALEDGGVSIFRYGISTRETIAGIRRSEETGRLGCGRSWWRATKA